MLVSEPISANYMRGAGEETKRRRISASLGPMHGQATSHPTKTAWWYVGLLSVPPELVAIHARTRLEEEE